MQNLILFIARYGVFLTFLLLQVISLTLVVKYNNTQQVIFINSSNIATGWLTNKADEVASFFNIRKVADSLSLENAKLRTALDKALYSHSKGRKLVPNDSIVDNEYSYLSAKVINNSVQLWDNKITLNKGSKHGIEKGMGVINDKGIVGIVTKTSKNFSQAYSILNALIRVSASHVKSGQFGTMVYQTLDPRFVTLLDLPKYADVAIGDTIVTNRFSSVFPDGILVGTVEEFEVEEGTNFYNIKVRLNQDLSKVDFVYVVNYLNKNEQLELESESDE